MAGVEESGRGNVFWGAGAGGFVGVPVMGAGALGIFTVGPTYTVDGAAGVFFTGTAGRGVLMSGPTRGMVGF